MMKVKKAQKGGCLSTTGSGTRTSIYKSAAGEGSSGGNGKAARQFARAERKMDKAQAKLDREEAAAKAKAPKAKHGMKVKKAQAGTKMTKAQFGTGLIKKGKAYLKKIEDEGNYQTKSFKTADSLRSANPKSKDLVGKVKERESNRRKADSIENVIEKRFNMPRKYNLYDNKKDGGKVKKAQAGKKVKGFGDHTDKMAKALDKASVLGKNYIAPGDSAKKKAVKKPVPKKKNGGTVSMQLGSYGRQPGKNYTGKAKMGKSVGKCKYGC